MRRTLPAATAILLVLGTAPAGPAFRIEVFGQGQGQLRAMCLYDGPVAEDATFDRNLFTCAAPSDSEPFWEAIARSAEVFEVIATEAE